jgi:hypothetical protein
VPRASIDRAERPVSGHFADVENLLINRPSPGESFQQKPAKTGCDIDTAGPLAGLHYVNISQITTY